MKYLNKYEGYSATERLDGILDKISKYGIDSLTPIEDEFLNSYSKGNELAIHDKIIKSELETVVDDDNGYFRFELDNIEKLGNNLHITGTIYVPDLTIDKKKERILGVMKGRIIVYPNGAFVPYFSKKCKKIEYDIFEFCEGLEYELDNFIDYIINSVRKYD